MKNVIVSFSIKDSVWNRRSAEQRAANLVSKLNDETNGAYFDTGWQVAGAGPLMVLVHKS